MRTVIVAEAGVNHNGSLETAKKLIETAAKAGADYVKFQTFKAETLTTGKAQKAAYQNAGDSSSNQFEMLKKLELSEQDHKELIEHCKKNNIKFLSTPFSESDADMLESMVDFFKVPSGELTNHNFLKHLARKKKPMVLSTGMADIKEVEMAVNCIKECWKDGAPKPVGHLQPLTVLQCTTAYPCPPEQANLLAILTMFQEFQLPMGFSDHTLGLEASIASVALGSVFVEKHFTLDKKMPGPDHKASLEPDELKKLVEQIRMTEKLLGDGVKIPQELELSNREHARKGLHFGAELSAGHVVKESDLLVRRPYKGVHPYEIDFFIGKTLKRDVSFEEAVKREDVE